VPQNLWNDDEANGLAGLDLLAYRSRLLAADRSVVNIFGGNTSTKVTEKDHIGRPTRVLWVKGSGSDMADCSAKSFAGLKLDEILPLLARESMSDEEMVDYLSRCTFEPGRPRQSIETLLHAFLPYPDVDHTHPDAIISLACTRRGRDAAREVFGERMAWVDYTRPGFHLSKQVMESLRLNPKAECVVMGKHGLVTWGDTSKQSYANAISIIQEAESAIAETNKKIWIGSETAAGFDDYDVLPVLRGAVSMQKKNVVIKDSSKRVMQMVGTPNAMQLSQIGAACPDHLVHVKRKPLFIDLEQRESMPRPPNSEQDADKFVRLAVESYREDYEKYFHTHAADEDTMFDSAPRVVLIRGVGMLAVGRNSQLARVSRDLYHRATEVIEGAEAMGGFDSLTEAEAFAIEYWPLELYKLKQRPPERELEGHIAVVTGGASGIGRAAAKRLASEGAHVAVLDINIDRAIETAKEIGSGKAIAIKCDTTDEEDVEQAFRKTISEWGGLDILVCSAGIASSAPIDSTTLDDWERTFAVLSRGYFLPSREAFRVWRRQAIGGSLIFVTSKNAVAAGKNASAYSAAKAAEQHLARCLAEEGGPLGVRVNCVMPDAVLQGSSIWDSEWRKERAEAYGIEPEQLEEFYRNRTTLKVSVYPEDIAEAILFLAGPRAQKTTGASLTVDGGVPAAYVR
jgi:rhamnulose-1-phosphate aldolase/alcohol dehydrogenase